MNSDKFNIIIFLQQDIHQTDFKKHSDNEEFSELTSLQRSRSYGDNKEFDNIFAARPIHVDEDDPILQKATKLDSLSTDDRDFYILPIDRGATSSSERSLTSPTLSDRHSLSEDSDSTRIYDLRTRQTTIIHGNINSEILNLKQYKTKSLPAALQPRQDTNTKYTSLNSSKPLTPSSTKFFKKYNMSEVNVEIKPAAAVESGIQSGSTEAPAVTTEVQAPVAGLENNAVEIQAPVAETEKPEVVEIQPPVVTVEEPVVNIQSPVAAEVEEPAVSIEPPVAIVEESAVSIQAPVVEVAETPVEIQAAPAEIEEPTVGIQTSVEQVEETPVTIQAPVVIETPVLVEESPVNIEAPVAELEPEVEIQAPVAEVIESPPVGIQSSVATAVVEEEKTVEIEAPVAQARALSVDVEAPVATPQQIEVPASPVLQNGHPSPHLEVNPVEEEVLKSLPSVKALRSKFAQPENVDVRPFVKPKVSKILWF